MSYFYEVNRPILTNTLYQTTRRDIQRSILQLEERLRKRKEVQRINAWEQIYQERLRQYELELRRKLSFAQEQEYKRLLVEEQIKKSHQRQRQYLYDDHLAKIDLLKRQQALLAKQRQLDRSRNIIDFQIRKQLQADQLLLRKYQDGTKVRQYDEELRNHYGKVKNINLEETAQNSAGRDKHFTQSRNYRQIQYDDNQKKQASYQKQTPKKIQTRKSALKRSPKQQIVVSNFNTGQKNNQNILEIRKQNKDYSGQSILHNEVLASKTPFITKEMLQNQIKREDQKFGKNSKKKDRSPYFRVKSASRSPFKKANRSITVSRLIKGQEQNRYNHGFAQNENDVRSVALAKIANRLKVSAILYKNPVFDDVKHQANRILSTYQNERALRKEIKQKINNNPKILKKHKMVVE